MAEVVWVERAIAALDKIVAHIRQFDERAADRYGVRLRAAGDSLAIFPDRGRLAAGGMRESVSVRPFVIRYRVVGDKVFILDIIHMAQRR